MNTIRLAILLAVFAAACDSTIAPICNPSAPAGVWSAQGKTLALAEDHTFVEVVNGSTLTGTWSADDSNITFVVNDGSQDAAKPYWVVGNDLVIGGPALVTWNPVCP